MSPIKNFTITCNRCGSWDVELGTRMPEVEGALTCRVCRATSYVDSLGFYHEDGPNFDSAYPI